jgi:group I intron endonuclease
MGAIYRIINTITGKMYIGKTLEKCPYSRWREHQRNISNNIGCPALCDAVNKYGISNFKFEIIIICFDEDASYYECEYIKKFNTIVPNGYNITKGGDGGGFVGKKHSDKTKELIKNRMIQYFKDPEKRKDNSTRLKRFYEQEGSKELARIRTISSEKWKKAKEEGRIGTNKSPPTNETKEKISAGLRKYNEQRRLLNKQV